MIRVGITGQSGFIGTHLFNRLGLMPQQFERIPFEDSMFERRDLLQQFVKQCDVIVHLAAMNRHESEQHLYDVNVELVHSLIGAMTEENVQPLIIFSSSTQETKDNLYGKSKRKGRELFEQWAIEQGGSFCGLVVPNVFGEFSRPNYNTFIATFASKLVVGECPSVIIDSDVNLIHVGSLCEKIIDIFGKNGVHRIEIEPDFTAKVSEILRKLELYSEQYLQKGIIPELKDKHEINLFNTFRSYISPQSCKLVKHSDERGVFVETIKLGVGGQVSFSTTKPAITRGNHFHTRKIERFTVIKGKALIQLRRIGENKRYEFVLDGSEPAYVDMPVWYTHNIKNIGVTDLYTQFWINEWYSPEDPDTYIENV